MSFTYYNTLITCNTSASITCCDGCTEERKSRCKKEWFSVKSEKIINIHFSVISSVIKLVFSDTGYF